VTCPGANNRSAVIAMAQQLRLVKDAAVQRSVELGQRYRGQVRIKGWDGRIQDERTYTRDPYPPKG
jgi:uncharacterized protein DUF2188